MKAETRGMGKPINKKDLEELLKETKETLAVEMKSEANHRIFGLVDLWNVQKRQKTTSPVRRWLQ